MATSHCPGRTEAASSHCVSVASGSRTQRGRAQRTLRRTWRTAEAVRALLSHSLHAISELPNGMGVATRVKEATVGALRKGHYGCLSTFAGRTGARRGL
jgi:hypothetical protein